MSKQIVITGGAGFIGSRLLDQLVRDGAGPITVIDNMARGRIERLAPYTDNPDVRFAEGDICDAALLNDLFAGATHVFHLAAQSNVMGAVTDIDNSFNANVLGTFRVLTAAKTQGVERVVFTSSREVYGEVDMLPVAEDRPMEAKNAYGASKAAGEQYCRVFRSTYGLETAVVRLANVYGPRDSGRVIPLWLDAIAEGRDLVVYGGEQVIDFVWVDQVVEALIRAADADGSAIERPINIGSGQGTPILELAERMLAISGANVELRREPARSVEVARFVADVERMRSILGIEPPSDPLFALPQLWAEYRENRR